MPYMDFPQCGFGRVLFWVGGTATWDGTAGTKWDTDPQGSGGDAVPTASDIVIFTPYSTGTVTLSNDARSDSVYFFAWTGTLSHPNTVLWQISGSLFMSSGMTYSPGTSGFGGILFNSGCPYPRGIDFAGHETRNVRFNGAGEWWLFSDLETTSDNLGITLTKGTFRTKGYELTLGGLVFTGTETRALYLGSSTINIGASVDIHSWDATDTTNLIFDAGTSTINSEVNVFRGGGLTYNNVSIETQQFADGEFEGDNTFNNLTITGDFGLTYRWVPSDHQTVTGTLTLTGNSIINKLLVSSDTRGTPVTITAANVICTNVVFRDIDADGDASWNFSGQDDVGDVFGNSGITFPAASNIYWVGNGGTWSTLSKWASASGGAGGSGRYPLPQDTAIFDSNSITLGAQTVNITGQYLPNINASAVTNNPNFAKDTVSVIYGSFINGSTTTMGLGGDWTFAGRGSHTISLAGMWGNGSWVNFNSVTGNYTFNSDFINSSDGTTARMRVLSGAVDFNDNDIKFPRIEIGDGATLSLGAGTITASGTISFGLNQWMADAGATINAETSTISLTNTGAVTFSGGGHTYYDVTFRSSANTATIDGSNTYNSLTATAPAVLRFQNNSTHTINTVNGLNMIGSAGNIINMNRVSSGVFTISSANNQTIDYCTLANCTGTGGGTFTATNTTDGGGNTNWSITP